MIHMTCRYAAVLATAIASLAFAQAASEVTEIERNHPISSPHPIIIENGSATISGVLGNVSGAPVNDLDFFSFWAQEGDVITLDIDRGWGGVRNVDTFIAVFSTSAGYPMLRGNNNASSIDEGSTSLFDARIDNFRVPTTGTYVVGVSNNPRFFLNGGMVASGTVDNGDYNLIISGVSSPVLHINIEIKPGSGEFAPVNPKSKGKIPVALLSSSEFDPAHANTSNLTFGSTGNEQSLHTCGDLMQDVNGDGRLDLVCHFDNQTAGFGYGDIEGILRGKTLAGQAFEGRGLLKVVPGKRHP